MMFTIVTEATLYVRDETISSRTQPMKLDLSVTQPTYGVRELTACFRSAVVQWTFVLSSVVGFMLK